MISKKMESSKNSEQIGMIMNNLVSFGHYQPTITWKAFNIQQAKIWAEKSNLSQILTYHHYIVPLEAILEKQISKSSLL